MLLTSKGRLPVSTINVVLLGVFWVGAIAAAITGHRLGAGFLALGGLGALIGALYARRPDSRDITRVNAIEYRDERDKRIAQAGFSVVGVVALVISVIEFVVIAAVADEYMWLPGLQLFVLCAVWATANSMAARRI